MAGEVQVRHQRLCCQTKDNLLKVYMIQSTCSYVPFYDCNVIHMFLVYTSLCNTVLETSITATN